MTKNLYNLSAYVSFYHKYTLCICTYFKKKSDYYKAQVSLAYQTSCVNHIFLSPDIIFV